MSFGIGDLSQLLRLFCNSHIDTVRSECEEQLVRWRESPAAFPMCMELISIAGVPESTSMFGLLTLVNMIRASVCDGTIASFPTAAVFERCAARVTAGPPADGTIRVNTILVLTLCVVYDCGLYRRARALSLPDLAFFFEFLLLELKNRVHMDPTVPLAQPPDGAILADALAVLGGLEVSAIWFSLHTLALGRSDSFEPFLCLLPRIDAALEAFTFEIGGALMSFYDEVLGTSPDNVMGRPDDVAYVTAVMAKMLTLAQRLMVEAERDDRIVPFVSVIMLQTIDYNLDFYGFGPGVAIGEAVFGEAMTQAQVFLALNTDEFFLLLQQVAQTLNYVPDNCEFDVLKWIRLVLGFIMDVISAGRYELCEERMEVIIGMLTGVEKVHGVGEFLAGQVETLTPGICYVLAHSADCVCRMLATHLAIRLVSVRPDQTPVTAVSFIATCARWAEDVVESFLDIVFFWMDRSAPAGVVAAAVRALATLKPQACVTPDRRYFQAIVAAVPRSDPAAARDLFVALFWIVPLLPSTDGELGSLLEELGRLFLAVLPSTLGSLDVFQAFVEFVIPIMEGVKLGDETQPILRAFFEQLYLSMQTPIGGLWGSPDVDVQEQLALFVKAGLEWGWLRDHAPAIDWISQVVQRHPVPAHFAVIEWLLRDSPIPVIVQFLNAIDPSDAVLIEAQMDLIGRLCGREEDVELVPGLFTFETLLRPLASPDPTVVSRAMSLFEEAICRARIPLAEPEIVGLMRTATTVFQAGRGAIAPMRYVSMLVAIGQAYLPRGITDVAQYLCETYSPDPQGVAQLRAALEAAKAVPADPGTSAIVDAFVRFVNRPRAG